MKRLFSLILALAAVEAQAITATKEYVDRATNEVVRGTSAAIIAATNGVPKVTDSTVAGWGYIKSWTESDPTVPSWAKATAKPSYTWTEVAGLADKLDEKLDKTDIPTALKCPNALTINVDGALEATYDGSAAKTVNITTGGGAPAPSAWKTESSIKWQSDGTAISISVPASGTLSANVSGWTDGQVQTARITIASGATISPTVKFVGYGYWPTDEEFLAACIRVGSSVFVNVISSTTH